MRSLFVIGGGGREHALARHLHQHHPYAALYCAPGNPGIADLATCLPIPATDLSALAGTAASLKADLTLVGPETPLVAGLNDVFEAGGLPVLGPSQRAAALEGSKVFAKDLMQRYGIPTAPYRVFDDPGQARRFVDQASLPLVVKADGLAAGKGVVMCDELDDAYHAIEAMLVTGVFGGAGRRIVIEERLGGEEASVFALVDGEAVALLPAAQDHKRLLDGDRGPNTGGMGAVAPVELPDALRDRIRYQILEPVAAALGREGRPYRGILFAGLMLTRTGPVVLEFNCRLGDPEAQVILPLLPISLIDAFEALSAGRLGFDDLTVANHAASGEVPSPTAAVGVVLASRGYPGTPETGLPIDGIAAASAEALVFHSGTAIRDGHLVTAGGRVLTVVGNGTTIADARARAYRACAQIRFDGMQLRRDIGSRLAGAVPAGRE
jgi:phosphoribosylamine--glycine ligase